MNVLVLHTQVPFTRGGAEVLVDGLASAIDDRGHYVDVVSLPLAWNPVERLLTTALAWRMLDLSSFNGRPVDRVICTKYPTWAVDHPNKALWLIHQHRQAYDLHGTPLSEFTLDVESQTIRRKVQAIDRRGLSECTPRFAISENVAGRLRRYTGLDAGCLYPPVPRMGLRPEAYEPFLLSVSRVDDAKRVGAVVEAWAHVQSDLKLVIAGDGPGLDALKRRVHDLGLDGRVELLGRVDDDRIRELYNHCRGVYYAPVDEDYGYATVEALTAAKPVVTAKDSGGVLEFVCDGETGLHSSLDSRELASTIDRLGDESFARQLGSRGPKLTESLTWDTVVTALLGDGDGGA